MWGFTRLIISFFGWLVKDTEVEWVMSNSVSTGICGKDHGQKGNK